MNPFQHGEVYVLQDGAETDLDLGHYERFVGENLTEVSSVTTGKIYSHVISEERKGSFLGGTIQIIPHITNAIKKRIKDAGKQNETDIVLIEIGGTTGDIEGLPYLKPFASCGTVGHKNTLLCILPYYPISPLQKSLKQSLRRLPCVNCALQVFSLILSLRAPSIQFKKSFSRKLLFFVMWMKNASFRRQLWFPFMKFRLNSRNIILRN